MEPLLLTYIVVAATLFTIDNAFVVVASGEAITKGDSLKSFDLIAILFDNPLELTDKLKYSGPIQKSVRTRALPDRPLS